MRRLLLGFGLVVVCGCGGKVVSDGSSGTSSGSPAPTTSTIVFPSPGNDAPPPNTASPPSKPPPDDGTYTALVRPGGLDHIEIFKADYANDRCIRLHLASPSTASTLPNIDTPASWAVASAGRRNGAKDCSSGRGDGSGSQPRDGKGSVTWPAPPAGKIFPCTLSVNVGLVFDDGTTEIFTRENLTVIGGC